MGIHGLSDHDDLEYPTNNPMVTAITAIGHGDGDGNHFGFTTNNPYGHNYNIWQKSLRQNDDSKDTKDTKQSKVNRLSTKKKRKKRSSKRSKLSSTKHSRKQSRKL